MDILCRLLFLIIFVVSLISCKQTANSENNTSNSTIIIDKNVGTNIGQKAPDIILKDTSQQTKTLSSFKGKYILLDFWASWCGPCIAEMPNFKKVRMQFPTDSLVIIGVSLDQSKENWINSIQKHQMNWYHMSDLKQWKSAVVPLYQIDGIPKTYVLDKDGIIIAKDLRGDSLVRFINNRLGNVK